MKWRGFTVVELLITITVMGILLTLGVVSLNATQVNGRDAERKGDIEAIQANLESFYRTGTDTSTSLGRYPSTVISSGNETTIKSILRDIDFKSLTAPNAATFSDTFISATNTTQTVSGVTPQPTITQYVYQPLQSNGSLCTSEAQECRKYNLFYRLENDNTVYKVTSKNQ